MEEIKMEIKDVCSYCKEKCKLNENDKDSDCPIYYRVFKTNLIPFIESKIILDSLFKKLAPTKEDWDSLIKQGIEYYIDTHIPYNDDGTRVTMTLEEVIEEIIFEELDDISLEEECNDF
jgi:hypothetical protein